jgi:hypothetical protein
VKEKALRLMEAAAEQTARELRDRSLCPLAYSPPRDPIEALEHWASCRKGPHPWVLLRRDDPEGVR